MIHTDRLSRVAAAMLFASTISTCAASLVENPADNPTGQTSTADADRLDKGRGVPDDYVIGEGDVVQISIWREPDASVPAAVVRPDGRISMPLLKQVQISGMTVLQAEKTVAAQLAGFIHEPDVTVVVKEIHSKKVYVVGAVKKEGPLAYTYRMTVLQAISEAGGVTDYAKRKRIYVLRSRDGKQSRVPFDYDAVLKGERASLNVELLPGDTVVVPH